MGGQSCSSLECLKYTNLCIFFFMLRISLRVIIKMGVFLLYLVVMTLFKMTTMHIIWHISGKIYYCSWMKPRSNLAGHHTVSAATSDSIHCNYLRDQVLPQSYAFCSVSSFFVMYFKPPLTSCVKELLKQYNYPLQIWSKFLLDSSHLKWYTV